MTIKVGDSLPDVMVKTLGAEGIKDMGTKEIFSHKKAVLFAVPGAFTSTCSLKHLPGFVDNAKKIKSFGVDLVACIAVNDIFVLDAWAKSKGIGGNDIMMISDGNAEFTKAIGLTLDASGFLMGLRSQRYAMVLVDGKITHLFVEKNPGEADASAAENIISHLSKNA